MVGVTVVLCRGALNPLRHRQNCVLTVSAQAPTFAVHTLCISARTGCLCAASTRERETAGEDQGRRAGHGRGPPRPARAGGTRRDQLDRRGRGGRLAVDRVARAAWRPAGARGDPPAHLRGGAPPGLRAELAGQQPGHPVDQDGRGGRLRPDQPVLPLPADADLRRAAAAGLPGGPVRRAHRHPHRPGGPVAPARPVHRRRPGHDRDPGLAVRRRPARARAADGAAQPLHRRHWTSTGRSATTAVARTPRAATCSPSGTGGSRVVRGPANTSTSRDRVAGLVEALRAEQVELDPALVREGSYSHQSGYQHTQDLLRLPDPPTAIVCGNDVVAFGALDAARAAGRPGPRATCRSSASTTSRWPRGRSSS